MICLYFDTFVTKVSVTYRENIIDARSACLLYRDTRILINNIIHKGRQTLMLVNYKQGVNKVGEAVFVLITHCQNAGTCCRSNIVEIIPFQEESLSVTGRVLQSECGEKRGCRDNSAPKPNNVLYISLSARQKSPTARL